MATRQNEYGVLGVLGCKHALVLLMLMALTCASQASPRLAGQSITRPIAVVVRISDEAAKTDEHGGTAALVESVIAGLTERGVQNEIFAADDDRPPAPRIEIWIEQWDEGDRAGRAGVTYGAAAATGLVGGVLGQLLAGDYSVVCKIYRDGDTAPARVTRYTGGIGGTGPEASTDAGRSVGRAIITDALTHPTAKSREAKAAR